MSIEKLAEHALPLNRSETFYTATVLPMLVCAENFRYFGRLTELAGIGEFGHGPRDESAAIEFFTDYEFVDSLIGPAKQRFANAPREHNATSAVALMVQPRKALLAIQARMFERPDPEKFQDLITSQQTLFDFVAGKLGIPPSDVAHVVLLPARFAADNLSLGIPVITWEQVLAAFGEVGPRYYTDVLRLALRRHDELVRRPRRSDSPATRLSGLDLYEQYRDGTLAAPWMEREGGLLGAKLQDDIDSKVWRTQHYECRNRHLRGNLNWFTVADFVARVDALDPASPANSRER